MARGAKEGNKNARKYLLHVRNWKMFLVRFPPREAKFIKAYFKIPGTPSFQEWARNTLLAAAIDEDMIPVIPSAERMRAPDEEDVI